MEIWELNHIIQDKAENDLVLGFKDVQEEIFEILKKYLFEFEIAGGKFNPKEKPSALINAIANELFTIVGDVDIDDVLSRFTDNFDEIEENIVKLHKTENKINIKKSLISSEKEVAIENTLFTLKDSNVNARFIDPVKKLLYNRVNNGAGVLDTENALRSLVTGDGELGLLERWVGQIARDSINQYEGNLNQSIKREFKLGAIRYVGSLVKDSRRQCERWVAKGRIEDKDLSAEIQWAFKNGSGMIFGTVTDTFCVHRGGYNCRHSAFPST